jgi:hypothetical protein
MRVEFRSAAIVALALFAMLGGSWLVRNQGESFADDDPVAVQEDEPSRRLPTYYGRLGLSDEQREAVYGLQASYGEQIDALLTQIEELRATRDAEMEALLTPGQKLRLQEMREEARRNADAETGDAGSPPVQP